MLICPYCKYRFEKRDKEWYVYDSEGKLMERKVAEKDSEYEALEKSGCPLHGLVLDEFKETEGVGRKRIPYFDKMITRKEAVEKIASLEKDIKKWADRQPDHIIRAMKMRLAYLKEKLGDNKMAERGLLEDIKHYAKIIYNTEGVEKKMIAIHELNGARMKRDLGRVKRVIKSYHNEHVDGSGNFGFVVVRDDDKWFSLDGDYDSNKNIIHLDFGEYAVLGSHVCIESYECLIKDMRFIMGIRETEGVEKMPNIGINIAYDRLADATTEKEVYKLLDEARELFSRSMIPFTVLNAFAGEADRKLEEIEESKWQMPIIEAGRKKKESENPFLKCHICGKEWLGVSADTDEAFELLMHHIEVVHGGRKSIGSENPGVEKMSEREIIELYRDKKWSILGIARAYDLDPEKIEDMLMKRHLLRGFPTSGQESKGAPKLHKMTDKEAWDKVMEKGKKLERGITHKLTEDELLPIFGTADFFDVNKNFMAQIIWDLRRAQYKLYDWIGMLLTGRMRGYGEDSGQLEMHKYFTRIMVDAYLLAKDIPDFVDIMRTKDYQIVYPVEIEWREWSREPKTTGQEAVSETKIFPEISECKMSEMDLDPEFRKWLGKNVSMWQDLTDKDRRIWYAQFITQTAIESLTPYNREKHKEKTEGFKDFQVELKKYKEKQEKCHHIKTTNVKFTDGKIYPMCISCKKLLLEKEIKTAGQEEFDEDEAKEEKPFVIPNIPPLPVIVSTSKLFRDLGEGTKIGIGFIGFFLFSLITLYGLRSVFTNIAGEQSV